MRTFRFDVLMLIEDQVDIEADSIEEAYALVESNLNFYAVNDINGASYPWDSVEIQDGEEIYP